MRKMLFNYIIPILMFVLIAWVLLSTFGCGGSRSSEIEIPVPVEVIEREPCVVEIETGMEGLTITRKQETCEQKCIGGTDGNNVWFECEDW